MRVGRCLLGALLAAGTTFVCEPGDPLVQAGADSTTSSGADIDVTARIGGRYADPAGIWVNPCSSPDVYVSERLADDAGARGLHRVRPDGVSEYLWQVSCENPETNELSYVTEFWVSAPTPGDIVDDLMEIVAEYLDPPAVEWPNSSPEHGWLFVKVPMDFRVTNLDGLTITASVTNAIGSSTASVTAEPDRLVFVSGEGGGAECLADEARQPYVPTVYGACSYEYQNSSSIAGGAFATRTTMFWEVSSDPVDADQPIELETWTEQALAVSEVQALVTCSGSGC